ncbi:hypothetical protein [Croceiramulus getboli]|nr:hypothetical protein P8624_10700 [Flavobacteriaceae bacterium YJPT1-3]
MEKRNLQSNVFSDTVMNNIQNLTDMSLDFYGTLIDNVLQNNSGTAQRVSQMSSNLMAPVQSMFNSDHCCPPKEECPPHCIASIHRKAMMGERIIVPFQVSNPCDVEKTYRVGLRPLHDQDGNTANSQPQLNKQQVSLPPHGSERVLMSLDTSKLGAGTYTAEIVLREKEYNQNICFTLDLSNHSGPTVTPHEEKKFKLKWQSWKTHFYCELPANQRHKG